MVEVVWFVREEGRGNEKSGDLYLVFIRKQRVTVDFESLTMN